MSKYYTVGSSEYGSLHFITKEEYEDYQADEKALFAKHKQLLRNNHGIWASNQNKYVASINELNDLDYK